MGTLNPIWLGCLARDVLLKSLVVHVEVAHRLFFDAARKALKFVHECLIVHFQFIFYLPLFVVKVLDAKSR